MQETANRNQFILTEFTMGEIFKIKTMIETPK